MPIVPVSRNALLFAAMCLVWGLTWLPMKVGASHVPPVMLAAVRFCVAGVLMLLWAGREGLRVPQAVWPRLAATALILNTGNYSLLFWGAAHAPSGLAAIVNFATIPICTLIASRLIEGNAITGRQIGAIALGTAGIVFLFAARAGGGGGDRLELLGLAAVAAGTLFYCLGAVWARPLAGRMPVLAIAGWQTLIGGFGLVAVSAALEPVDAAAFARLVTWPVLPSLAFLVFGGSLVGFTVYVRLLRDWGAFRAGLYAFVSPAIAVAVGVVVLSEPFGPAEAAGALMMFAAAAIALRRRPGSAPAGRRGEG